jgi:ABC-type Mn2+/Zn2+ transport system permease subunit
VDADGSSSLPSQLGLALVCSVLLGMCACVAGVWMTYLPGALQVPLSSAMAGVIVPVALGLSSSDGGGAEPLSKRALT